MMILELHRQGVSVTAIARRTGRDPKTVRKYIEHKLEPPGNPGRFKARAVHGLRARAGGRVRLRRSCTRLMSAAGRAAATPTSISSGRRWSSASTAPKTAWRQRCKLAAGSAAREEFERDFVSQSLTSPSKSTLVSDVRLCAGYGCCGAARLRGVSVCPGMVAAGSASECQPIDLHAARLIATIECSISRGHETWL